MIRSILFCSLIAIFMGTNFLNAKGNATTSVYCPPLAPPAGNIVSVSTVSELVTAANNAEPNTTILIVDGVYNLAGAYLRIAQPGVVLRSAHGNREAVVLDGDYISTEIIQIVASNVTIADLTLREAYNHPIHVMSTDSFNTNDTFLYNLHIIDPGQQAIKVNPADSTHYTDRGVIACSQIELTDTGRAFIRDNCYTGGIDAHQSQDWVIRDNIVEGFWCQTGLSEHAIHFWRGSRDTLVERNVIINNARGIGFGMAIEGVARTYPDNPCPQAEGTYVDHFGGIVRNNFIFADSEPLYSSDFGFDCGICLWTACNVEVLHNTVYSTQPPFSSIEWRFSNTWINLTNNLTSDSLRERDGAHAVQAGNITAAQAAWFINAPGGDLHLSEGTTIAIDQGAPVPEGLCNSDFDGDPRPIGIAPDVGADEVGTPTRGDQLLFLPMVRK